MKLSALTRTRLRLVFPILNEWGLGISYFLPGHASFEGHQSSFDPLTQHTPSLAVSCARLPFLNNHPVVYFAITTPPQHALLSSLIIKTLTVEMTNNTTSTLSTEVLNLRTNTALGLTDASHLYTSVLPR